MSTNQELFSLQQLVLHKLAKKLWINCFWQDPEFKSKSSSSACYEDFLFEYAISIKNSPPTFVPKLLRDKLVTAAMNLTIGYEEAIAWQNTLSFKSNICRNHLPFSVLCPDSGQYEASNFVTPLGHFKDLRWTELFLADKDQPIMCRFILACVYCFEEMISSLWHEMKSKNLLPYGGNLKNIKEEFGDYIALWAYRMENEIDEEVLTNGFYVVGFNRAVLHRHEYGARFFWEHCSAEEKNDLVLPKLKHYDHIMTTHDGDGVRIIFFLYSLLSVEQKNEFIAWCVSWAGGEMFGSMLCTHFGETILNDLMTFSYPMLQRATCFFNSLLKSMIFNVRHLLWRFFIFTEMFEKLWKKLSDEQQIELLRSTRIFDSLNYVDDIYLFETIIIHLPLAVKREMLLENWESTMPLFEIISMNYDRFLFCLVLYFLQYNHVDRKLTLRVDALDFFDAIIHCKWYASWLLRFDSAYVHIIHEVMQHFRKTLPLLHQVLTEIERETTGYALNFHGVLSEKIYPILPVNGRFPNPRRLLMTYKRPKLA